MLGEIMFVNLKFIKNFLVLFGGLKFYAYICNRKQMNKQNEKVKVGTRSTGKREVCICYRAEYRIIRIK